MLSCVFEVFVAFLILSRIKWSKIGFFGSKLDTQHYFVYVIVLKWLELKTIIICFKLCAKLGFWGFQIKFFKLILFGTKLGKQYYLVYVIMLKGLESKIIVMCLKLRAILWFWGFSKVFLALSRINWFKFVLFPINLTHNTIWYMLLWWNG